MLFVVVVVVVVIVVVRYICIHMANEKTTNFDFMQFSISYLLLIFFQASALDYYADIVYFVLCEWPHKALKSPHMCRLAWTEASLFQHHHIGSHWIWLDHKLESLSLEEMYRCTFLTRFDHCFGNCVTESFPRILLRSIFYFLFSFSVHFVNVRSVQSSIID